MKTVFVLAIAAGLIYSAIRLAPEETRSSLASIGLAQFFRQTLPGYLREKLAIPQNPVAKRAKLLEELTAAVTSIEKELEAAVPLKTNGLAPPLPRPQEIRARVEQARELLANTEEKIRQLEGVSAGEGFLRQVGTRLLDRILPLSPLGGGPDAAECRSASP